MSSPSDLNGKRAVVTGANGFVGRHVVREFLDHGCQITTVYDNIERLDGCHHVVADLTRRDITREWSDRADFVVHLAAQSGGIQSQNRSGLIAANVAMTSNALRIAERAGAGTIVLASSGVVYEPPDHERSLRESDPVVTPSSRWMTNYAWSKLSSEIQCVSWAEETGGRAVIARLATLFGSGGKVDDRTSSVIHALIHRASVTSPDAPLEVWGDGSPVRTFSHVADAARAFALLTGVSAATGIFNVSTTGKASIAEVASMILQALGRDPGQIRFLTDRPSGPAYRILDGSRLRAIGFQSEFDLETGIVSTVRAITGAGNSLKGLGR